MKNILINLIKVYKATLSPIFTHVFGKGCIYTPTCSTFAIKAIKKHGAIKGVGLATKRFLTCHPYSKGGYNPVPEIVK